MLAIFAEKDNIVGFSSPADAERLDVAAKAANLNSIVKYYKCLTIIEFYLELIMPL